MADINNQPRDDGKQSRKQRRNNRQIYNMDPKDVILLKEKLRLMRGPTTNLVSKNGVFAKKYTGSCTLIVRNLPAKICNDTFREMFEQFGKITKFIRKQKEGFGLVELDTHQNAESARASLDSTFCNNKLINVHFAPNKDVLRVKYLNPWVSNELLYAAFSVFGDVVKAVVIVDDQGRPVGEGIVEFACKESYQFANKFCKQKCYLLTRYPRPVMVERFNYRNEEEGFPEKYALRRNKQYREQYHQEREVSPRFAKPGTLDFKFSERWQNLYQLERQKWESLEKWFSQECEQVENYVRANEENLFAEQNAVDLDISSDIDEPLTIIDESSSPGTIPTVENAKTSLDSVNDFTESTICDATASLNPDCGATSLNSTICDAAESLDSTVRDATESLESTVCDATQSLNSTVCDASSVLNSTACDATESRDSTVCDATPSLDSSVCDATPSLNSTACDATKSHDSTISHDKSLPVDLAPCITAIKVKNLSQFVTNELLGDAFSVFGDVKRAVVITDAQMKSVGEGIVEYASKHSQQLAIKNCNNKFYLLTKSPCPVVVEPLKHRDYEYGLPEKNFSKSNEQYLKERAIGVRIHTTQTVEFLCAIWWKKLYRYERLRRELLETEISKDRKQLRQEMKNAIFKKKENHPKRKLNKMEEQGSFIQQETPPEENMASEDDVSSDLNSDKDCKEDCLASTSQECSDSNMSEENVCKRSASPLEPARKKSKKTAFLKAKIAALNDEEKLKKQLLLNEEKRKNEEHLERMKLLEAQRQVQELLSERLKANPSCINMILDDSVKKD